MRGRSHPFPGMSGGLQHGPSAAILPACFLESQSSSCSKQTSQLAFNTLLTLPGHKGRAVFSLLQEQGLSSRSLFCKSHKATNAWIHPHGTPSLLPFYFCSPTKGYQDFQPAFKFNMPKLPHETVIQVTSFSLP